MLFWMKFIIFNFQIGYYKFNNILEFSIGHTHQAFVKLIGSTKHSLAMVITSLQARECISEKKFPMNLHSI